MAATETSTKISPHPVRWRGAACLLGVVGLFALDGLFFRTSLYPSILEVDSSTGQFEYILERERGAQAVNGDNMVVTLGDSRLAYSPKLSNEVTSKTGYVFRNAGIAGSDVRAWYYMLRDLDPTARRYRAVVFGLNEYEDEDEYFNPYDDIRVLHYVAVRLRYGDVFEFARSFQSRPLQWEAFRGGLLKGIVFQSDILAFLANPGKRLKETRQAHKHFDEWTYGYLETPRSMAGLEIDWSAWKAKFPPGVDQDQMDTVNNGLMHTVAPQIGRMAAYRRTWYGRILDRYRGSRTKIIFLRLPRGPIPRPDRVAVHNGSTIRDFAASRPGVLLCDEHAFETLEHPELFRDGLHLNREGIARFSPMLAETIAAMLGR